MEMRKLKDLKGWDKNPRKIKDEDYQRLKKQIKKLGQYKPLIITPDGEVLGGNMRLKAYQELKIDDIWVSVVKPKDENEKLEYALSDNDRAGYYDEKLLTEMMSNYKIDLKAFSVDLGSPINLENLFNSDYELPEPTQTEPEVYEGFLVNLKVPRTKWDTVKPELDKFVGKYELEVDIS